MIISCLNEYGILNSEVEKIADHINEDINFVCKVLKKVQNLDPPGVGAKNSEDYILLQTKRLFGDDSMVTKVANAYFNAFREIELASSISSEKQKIEQIQYNAQKTRRKVINRVSDTLDMPITEIESYLKKNRTKHYSYANK